MSNFDITPITQLVLLALLLNWIVAQWKNPKVEKRIRRLEMQIQILFEKTGVYFDFLESVTPQIRQALQDGNKIQAIKLYREATGAGLAEAKKAVETRTF